MNDQTILSGSLTVNTTSFAGIFPFLPNPDKPEPEPFNREDTKVAKEIL
jgi:hypothetical protein